MGQVAKKKLLQCNSIGDALEHSSQINRLVALSRPSLRSMTVDFFDLQIFGETSARSLKARSNCALQSLRVISSKCAKQLV